MAHRGRLNVLANIMEKSYKEIFSEFQGKNYDEDSSHGGDVKYHLGYSTDVEIAGGKKVHLSLCFLFVLFHIYFITTLLFCPFVD
jgi:2-oxoglutarate dehydrogenase E1 component